MIREDDKSGWLQNGPVLYR